VAINYIETDCIYIYVILKYLSVLCPIVNQGGY